MRRVCRSDRKKRPAGQIAGEVEGEQVRGESLRRDESLDERRRTGGADGREGEAEKTGRGLSAKTGLAGYSTYEQTAVRNEVAERKKKKGSTYRSFVWRLRNPRRRRHRMRPCPRRFHSRLQHARYRQTN